MLQKYEEQETEEQEAEEANADWDVTADAGKINEDDYNMIISIKQEYKTL